MKTAEEWTQLYFNATAEEMGEDVFASHVAHVKLIQQDCLREAAKIADRTEFIYDSQVGADLRMRSKIRDAIISKVEELDK